MAKPATQKAQVTGKAVRDTVVCRSCKAEQHDDPVYKQYRVCGQCGHHFLMTAQERVDLLVDKGSFVEDNAEIVAADPLHFLSGGERYQRRLNVARQRTGLNEAVVTGHARLGGLPVQLIIFDFRFMGGSMSGAVGEKIVRAAERAVGERKPLIAVTSSGGARIQEGMLALVQMAKTATAVERLHKAGVPFFAVLTHPTTGGVFASFSSLADVLLAEPKALIGFAGPRVVEALTKEPLPPGSHRAEFQLEHGLIDGVVDRRDLREILESLLAHTQVRFFPMPIDATGDERLPRKGRPRWRPWKLVRQARHPSRPTAADYIEHMVAGFVPLQGDRLGHDDPAIIGGPGRIGKHSVMVVAQERSTETNITPGGFRKAQRLMKLGAKWGLPIVTFVDTIGADPRVESEAEGIGNSIATSLGLMSTLPTPTLAVVIGEGGSGGALAMGAADWVMMQQNAFYSVISPEGAASIIFRDADKAARVAPDLRLTAHNLLDLGVVDEIVAESRGGAHADPDAAIDALHEALCRRLPTLVSQPLDVLLAERYKKYRNMGAFETK